MMCGNHYQEHASDDSDHKEDAVENYSKYHSSDLPDQEDDGTAQAIDKDKIKTVKPKIPEVDPSTIKMEED